MKMCVLVKADTVTFTQAELLTDSRKGYPPHDARVDEGQAEIGQKSNRPVETLQGKT